MVSSGIQPVDEAIRQYELLRTTRNARFIIFKVQESGITVDSVGERDLTFEHFKSRIPPNEPRYGVFDYAFEKAGSHQEKLMFIVWSPETSSGRSKMMIASGKEAFKHRLEGISRELQATDASELTLENLDEVARRI